MKNTLAVLSTYFNDDMDVEKVIKNLKIKKGNKPTIVDNNTLHEGIKNSNEFIKQLERLLK